MKRTLDDFFSPTKSKSTQKRSWQTDAAPDPEMSGLDIHGTPQESVTIMKDSSSAATSQSSSDLDIGIVNQHILTEAEKLRILSTQWSPPPGFQWPYSERQDGNKTRRKYLGKQHMEGQYDVFSYSVAKNGVFCRPCVLFAPTDIRGVKLNRLVKSPLQSYTHLTGKDGYLTTHLANKFHEDCVNKSHNFRRMITGKAGNVMDQLNAAAMAQKEKNRATLKRILQSVEFLGRLGIPLRGHRDSGALTLPDPGSSNINYDQGNLRATLQLMVSCNDTVLRDHITNAGANATYISPETENEIICIIATVIKADICDEVKQAKFFSLLADETTDVSRMEQLTVCLRYLRAGQICERFLTFAEATDMTGAGLAAQLLQILSDAGVDLKFMVGQGYDGAAAMSGHLNGVQKHVRDKCPSSIYVHCVSHSLNLCLMKAGEIPEIRKAVTLMHELAFFYKDSNLRLRDLEAAVESQCPASSHQRLKYHCKTRWVERQEAVRVFKELLPAVRHSLQNISLWTNSDASGKAHLFLTALEDGGFHVALQVLVVVLDITKPLSVKLQAKSQDLFHAIDSVQDCQNVLQQLRSEEKFKEIFSLAEREMGTEIRKPRCVGRQQNRANYDAASAEIYYRISLFYSYIDICVQQLQERFQRQGSHAYQLSSLLPAFCQDANFETLLQGATLFAEVLEEDVDSLESEFLRCRAYWTRTEEKPTRVVDALETASRLGTYPLIKELLQIFATIPVTTTTGERSFSALKLIKTYLRSTMREDRMNGLAHLYINKDLPLDYSKVIDEFGRKNRKLSF